MKLGVISDLHGNATALESVIADGVAAGVDRWWVLGDLVAIGPEPSRTLTLLADLPRVELSRGNTDRYVVTGERPGPHAPDVVRDPDLLPLYLSIEASFSWTRGALSGTGWLDWLEALPLELRIELPDGTRLLGVHASPGRDDGDGITPYRPDKELHEALAGAEADIVLAGHTHQATDRRVGSVRAVNLGSVSNPVTSDLRASYVIVHADRHAHRLEPRRVAYDQDVFLATIDRSGHPVGDFIASFQRGEQVKPPASRPAVSGPRWSDA